MTNTVKAPITKRSLSKFGRDLIVASVAFIGVYFVDNIYTLTDDPALGAALTSFALFGYRIARDLLGLGPREG